MSDKPETETTLSYAELRALPMGAMLVFPTLGAPPHVFEVVPYDDDIGDFLNGMLAMSRIHVAEVAAVDATGKPKEAFELHYAPGLSKNLALRSRHGKDPEHLRQARLATEAEVAEAKRARLDNWLAALDATGDKLSMDRVRCLSERRDMGLTVPEEQPKKLHDDAIWADDHGE